MKKPRVFQIAEISAADLAKMNHRCAWKGCTATTPVGPIPRNWRWLLMYWDRSGGDPNPFRGGIKLDRDAVLCPQHWRELDSLLEDIGQHLDQTKGSA